MDRWKQKIADGQVLFGTHITDTDMHNAKVLGHCGYDYFWIDMEHTQITKKDVCNILMAARAVGPELAAFVRVPVLDPAQVKPILEMGPTGIIFPMIFTEEDVDMFIMGPCDFSGAYDYENIRMRIDKGVSMISVGSEPAFMIDGSMTALGNMRRACEDSRAGNASL